MNVYSSAVIGRYECINMINWGRELLSCTNYIRLHKHHSSKSLLSFQLIIVKTSTLTTEWLLLPAHCDPAMGIQPRITSECVRVQVSARMELRSWCRSSSVWKSRGVSHRAQETHYLWVMCSYFRKQVMTFNNTCHDLEPYLLFNARLDCCCTHL